MSDTISCSGVRHLELEWCLINPLGVRHLINQSEGTAACVLCGSSVSEPVLRAKRWDPGSRPDLRCEIVRCQGCGLAFLDPQPSGELLKTCYPEAYYAYQESERVPIAQFRGLDARLDQWAKRGLRRAFSGYPAPRGAIERWLLRLLLWPLWLRLRLLGKDLKIIPFVGRGRFLEIGCGTGGSLEYQRLYGLIVSGVELNPSAADVARARHGLDVRTGTLEAAGFPGRAFDIAYLCHVFEHLPDPAAALDELRRVLDDRGLLILKIPNIASWSAERFGPHWLGWDLPRHLFHFSPGTITALLARHGFALEAIRQDLGSWGFWRESRRIAARETGHPPPSDSWWSDLRDQLAERVACARGRGSNIVVYARKTSSTSDRCLTPFHAQVSDT